VFSQPCFLREAPPKAGKFLQNFQGTLLGLCVYPSLSCSSYALGGTTYVYGTYLTHQSRASVLNRHWHRGACCRTSNYFLGKTTVSLTLKEVISILCYTKGGSASYKNYIRDFFVKNFGHTNLWVGGESKIFSYRYDVI
jgi:hypothetical protein